MAELEKAMFFDPDEPSSSCVYVQFNPNTLEYRYGREPHKKGAKEDGQEREQQSPLAVREQASLSMRLFFNTYKSETSYTDVRKELLPLRDFLCRTDEKETAKEKTVIFAWGSLAYKGTMDSFSVTYQMFASDGVPVQAEVSLSISGEDTELSEGTVQRKAEEMMGEDMNWLFEEE